MNDTLALPAPRKPPARTLSRRESASLADRLAAAAAQAADRDTAGVLADLVCDLVNHHNGHPTWLTAKPRRARPGVRC
jgi:hypothetical protein